MKIITVSAVSAIFFTALCSFAAGANSGEKTVVITANDTLRFNVSHIEAVPGEMLHIQLRNTGTLPKDAMGHNWVLLTADESADAFAAAAMNAKAESFQPAALKDKIIAAVPLLGPGEVGEVSFPAPMIRGKYAFLCSFPGHCSAGMHGVLTVK